MSTLKVDTLDTRTGSGNITVSRPLSGSGASLTALNASELGSGTVPDARFPSTLPALNGSALTNLPAQGITEVDNWRLHTSFTNSNVSTYITSNLERNDSAFTKMGTGMTQSSGVFTFPSTGLWEVGSLWEIWKTAVVIYFFTEIHLATDGGSSFTNKAYGTGNMYGTGNGGGASFPNKALINVTNTSNFKVKFRSYASATGIRIEGNSTYDRTCFWFIRLGDSQ